MSEAIYTNKNNATSLKIDEMFSDAAFNSDSETGSEVGLMFISASRKVNIPVDGDAGFENDAAIGACCRI